MARGIDHKGAQQVHTIDNDVILLRLVDFKKLGVGLTDTLRNTDLRPGEKEGDQPWFLEGYISLDHPRDLQMSRAILKASQGFGIARTDTGEVIATFEASELERASKVADRARAEVAVQMALEDVDSEKADAEANE